ncbi:DNA glycosylase [Xylaria nigripes]|nr:DNA glycosylase [Xylaria nigripes]
MDYNADQEPLTRTAERAQNKTDGSCEDLQVKPKRVPRKTKDNPYGLTPGRSPLPDWQAPSMAQCEEVYDILSGMHGKLEQPEIIPAPSLEVAGCGEVPFVLEALLRTLLSGAVTMGGAGKMVQAIIAEYGILQDDLAKGSIDWNKVRLSSIEHLENTIRIGGLASRKAKAIKGTLDMVYEENIKRRDAYLTEKATGVAADVYGASERTQGQKDLEILKTERNILSLDHMYGLSVDEAMREFTKFPGIGVKTAACVILFCLQRPCFAVDTHVHRFSKWLGWVPNKADEDTTFGHLEVRCPDHLKYGLHQLFIKHGTTCGRCKMITVEGTKDWEAIVCPLEHLLVRGKKTSMAQRKLPENKSRKASSEKDSSGPEFPEADETISDEDYKA